MKYLVAVSLVFASFFSWAVTTSDFGSWSLLCNDSSVCTLSQLVAKDKEAKKCYWASTLTTPIRKIFQY